MTPVAAKQTGKTIARNVAYGFLTWLLPLGLSFAATRILVHSLGTNDYGIYALVLGFIGYSFTFSLGRAITKYIAEYRIAGEYEKISGVISATFFINLAVGVLGVVSMLALAGWLVRDVFSIGLADQEKAVIAMYVASGVIFLSMISQVFAAILQGIQRFDVYSKILTAGNFVLISGNILIAYLGYGLISLLFWNLVVLTLSSLTYYKLAKRLLPEFSIGFGFDRTTLRTVLRYSSGVIAYQIFANLFLLFERGWITYKLGSEFLTYYVVPMSLGMQLQAFISSLVLVVFPLASELKDDKAALLRLYTKATKVISVLVVFLIVTFSIHNELFLTLWMGAAFSAKSAPLLPLHIACFGLISIMSVSWLITEGLGYPQFNAVATAVCTTVGIILMIILTADYGNIGAAVARFSAFALIFFSIFIVERWFFDKVQFKFWGSLIATLVVGSAVAGVTEYYIATAMAQTWIAFLLSVFAGGILYLSVLWMLGIVTADDKLLMKRALSRG